MKGLGGLVVLALIAYVVFFRKKGKSAELSDLGTMDPRGGLASQIGLASVYFDPGVNAGPGETVTGDVSESRATP